MFALAALVLWRTLTNASEDAQVPYIEYVYGAVYTFGPLYIVYTSSVLSNTM